MDVATIEAQFAKIVQQLTALQNDGYVIDATVTIRIAIRLDLIGPAGAAFTPPKGDLVHAVGA